MLTTEKNKKDEKIQVASLLPLLSPESTDVFRMFIFDPLEDNFRQNGSEQLGINGETVYVPTVPFSRRWCVFCH